MTATGHVLEAAFSSDRLAAAQAASADVVRRTPVVTSASLAAVCGGTIMLKAENLQRTGSFKLRGALNKVRATEGARGVVAGSAGNHAQALAYAARAYGLPCEVFMPVDASISKVMAVKAFGATVHRQGSSVDDCVALARTRAEETGLAFVHPFDDPEIVVGQAGLGVELAQDVPELATVVVPIGGGGLAAGTALAVKQARPDVRVVGVQAAACAAFPSSLQAGEPVLATSHVTIADGIAIKRPGNLTLELVETWLDDVVTVEEEAIAEAMVFLLERAKLVVEGAGAASVAALVGGAVRPADSGATVAVLSGGNVDVALVAALASRHETSVGRRSRYVTRVDDRPGGLVGLLSVIADTQANVLSVEHVRDGVGLGVRQTGVEFTVETREEEHTAALVSALEGHGYEVTPIGEAYPCGADR
jgi:threonine dehydratase